MTSMTSVTDLRSKAQFYRAGVAGGILDGADAVAWADRVILTHPAPPPAIYDVSLARPHDVTAVVDALSPLGEPQPLTETIARALLDVVRRKLASGQFDCGHAITVAYRMTLGLEKDSNLFAEAISLEDDYALAEDGIVSDVATMDAEIRAWLAEFSGAASAFLDAAS